MKIKVLIIDNYDSFTFNLVQLIGRYTDQIIVKRNDQITIQEIINQKPDKIVISPGPGRPENSAVCLDVIRELSKSIPVLGVCLGHQAIGYVFGARIENASNLMHGKVSYICHDNRTIYKGIEQNFIAGRYHSLIINKDSLNSDLEISSYTFEGEIMGIRHKRHPIEGIQFHPESILTKNGDILIYNWLNL